MLQTHSLEPIPLSLSTADQHSTAFLTYKVDFLKLTGTGSPVMMWFTVAYRPCLVLLPHLLPNVPLLTAIQSHWLSLYFLNTRQPLPLFPPLPAFLALPTFWFAPYLHVFWLFLISWVLA